MAVLAIPEEPEAMTPAWLTTALRGSGLLTEAVVTAVRWQPLAAQGWTTQMARLSMTYKESEVGLPATLVAKLSAREASIRAFFGRFYAREVAFYRWVAPEVSLPGAALLLRGLRVGDSCPCPAARRCHTSSVR